MEKMLAENHINLLLRAYSSVCEALDISLPWMRIYSNIIYLSGDNLFVNGVCIYIYIYIYIYIVLK